MDYISRELPRRFQKPTLFQFTHEQPSKQRAFQCSFTDRPRLSNNIRWSS